MEKLNKIYFETHFSRFMGVSIILFSLLLIIYGFSKDELQNSIDEVIILIGGIIFLVAVLIVIFYNRITFMMEKLIIKTIKSHYGKILKYLFFISAILLLLITAQITNLIDLEQIEFLKNKLEYMAYAGSIPIMFTLYLIIFEFMKILEVSSTSSEILNRINDNKDIYSKEMEKIAHHLSWSKNIYRNGQELDTLWVLLKNDYLSIERKTIDKKNIITSLEYYPAIVKSILKHYLISMRHPDTKIELVTTMLPEHFFNFPSYTRKDKNLLYRQQNFVDDYRKNLVEIIELLKNKNYSKDSFQRYTLVYGDQDNTKYDDEIYTLEEIYESKKIYISEESSPITCYEKDKLSYKECSIVNKSAYTIDYKEDNEKDRIKLIDFFQNSLHLSGETSYIVPLTKDNLVKLSKNYDYLLIKSKECDICIKANISLDNNSVLIEIIEGIKLKEIKSTHKRVIFENTNKISLNDFIESSYHTK